MSETLSGESFLAFLRRHHVGVVATASLTGLPEAALVNYAVTPELEIVFETTTATRKYPNLIRNPRADMVIGWDDDQTLQCCGPVDVPEDREGERLKAAFLSRFPEKASHGIWPGNSYVRLRLSWARFSDYSMPRRVSEIHLPAMENAKKRPFWRMFEGLRPGGGS